MTAQFSVSSVTTTRDGLLRLALRADAALSAIDRRLAWAVVAGNVAWAVVSVIALIADWLPLTTAGAVVTVVMALHTSVFADLQFLGLRRLGT